MSLFKGKEALSSGRPSTSSSLAGYTPVNYSQGIGYSPSIPASPASSGIPSFRSLRSLLPFGSNKNATTTPVSTSPNTRTSFGAFSSVRRSMTKDRQVSLSNDAPVIAIEKSFPDDTPVIRRSVSLSKIEKPLPSEPTPKDPSSTSLGDNLLPSSFTLRTPSPGPALSAELSTIIEADNSGISKHITANSSPITNANRNTISTTQEHNTHTHTHPHECDVDASAMDLSTTHLEDLVRNAIREGDSLKGQWLNADKAVIIIDADEHLDIADTTFNMESIDRDLADLLSPHSISAAKQGPSSPITSTPSSPNFPASPASRLPRARQTSSFIPRLRSSNSPSIPQTPIHHTHTPPPPKPSPSIVNGHNTLKPTSSPSTRMRKRSMSVQDSRYVGRNRGGATSSASAAANEDLLVRSGSSLSSYANKTTSNRGGGGGMENGSNTNESSGPKMEWLGPRTAKAFRAAGLMDFDHREKESREEVIINSESTTERLPRDRSGSANGEVLSPSPLGIGNPASNLNRFASLRSASEYNPIYGRSHSRLTLSSEAGSGAPRRGSESFYNYGGASSHGGGGGGGGSSYGHNALMESPTFTVSSGSRDRDTPKSSVSTGPTSLADSLGYLGRDRDRDRERELEMMKEKHGTEMGALLGALSDSQRTVRVLREENSDLRDRLERFTVTIQTNQELRRVCGDLQGECGSLRKENTDLRKELIGLRGLSRGGGGGGGGNSSGVRTPVPRIAMNNSNSSPLGRTFTPRVPHEEEYDNTFIDHGSKVENHITERGSSSPDINIPSPSSKKRRLSNSSSIFPIPASNMTLLLHEDVTTTLGNIGSCSRSSIGTEHSQYGFSLPPPPIRAAASTSTPSQRIKTHVRSMSHSPPVSYHNFSGNIPPNSSVVSVGSISPSMVTGSPGSLFLRPEHEILLGDMESLDLGVRGDDGVIVDDNVNDGW